MNMQFIAIVLFSVAAAIFYGIVHDQITARVCVEYFTIGHPPVFHTNSPTLLALGWGVIATWWVGLPLGIFLAGASRFGMWPKLRVRDLLVPTLCLLLVIGVAAAFFGWRGFLRSQAGNLHLPAGLAAAVPLEKHAAFIADWFAHLASYAVGALGGLALCLWALQKRRKLMKNN
jgi:hypothetical protein